MSCVHELLLVFFALVGTTVGCATHYGWKQGSARYHVVERGQLLQLVDVSIILETSNPFNGWAEPLLLQPCGSAGGVQPDVPPCWPDQERARTQELLASLYSDAPDYRGKLGLLRLARYLNRDIGTFRRAWIIGTNPLAVAFLEGPPDQIPPDVQRRLNQVRELTSGPDARASTRPTTRPGYIEVVTRSGEVVPVDLRVRDARFVTEADLNTLVDRILLYPQDMPLSGAGQRPAPGADPPHRVKVFQLSEPVSIESVMRALTEPGKLERGAKTVREAPVLIHP
jgi:hypothetical protein